MNQSQKVLSSVDNRSAMFSVSLLRGDLSCCYNELVSRLFRAINQQNYPPCRVALVSDSDIAAAK